MSTLVVVTGVDIDVMDVVVVVVVIGRVSFGLSEFLPAEVGAVVLPPTSLETYDPV